MDVAIATKRDEFQALLEPVAAVAYKVAYNLTRNEEDAMDLVQDSTVSAFRAFDTFQKGTNFRAWFLKILTNRFFKTRSRGRVETTPIDEAEDVYLYKMSQQHGLLGNEDDPARLVLDRMDVEAVGEAMQRLPVEFRAAATLYFLNDFTYEQIAEMLEIPVGTVRSRLHRGRKLMQKVLWDIARERGIVDGEAPEATHA
ncbi:MAG: sigma-70 family RNA polymerase sigma factor [Fimbriimonadaceae bacterium]|nr:sigma-70 family RNA polymerase sigma factor [Fimbriimonadaceae bacterium]QYK56714.1 MAG: sigma-70 family RNA polymerase sigma factor [Fimbriimonadaceae bacterium]